MSVGKIQMLDGLVSTHFNHTGRTISLTNIWKNVAETNGLAYFVAPSVKDRSGFIRSGHHDGDAAPRLHQDGRDDEVLVAEVAHHVALFGNGGQREVRLRRESAAHPILKLSVADRNVVQLFFLRHWCYFCAIQSSFSV